MVPCCELSGEKYIRPDRTVDEELLLAAINKLAARKLAAMRDGDACLLDGKLVEPCKCACHIVGMVVKH